MHVGGIAIYLDDLLHAERNGVTTVSRGIASEVADIDNEYNVMEMLIIEAVREFRSDSARLHAAQAESKARMEKMRSRVTHKIVRVTLSGCP